MEYFVLMERGVILCIYESLQAVLSWQPEFKLNGPLEIHKVRRSDGEFKTQIIKVAHEAFVPLRPSRRPYLPPEAE
jgi:hypothetical protein